MLELKVCTSMSAATGLYGDRIAEQQAWKEVGDGVDILNAPQSTPKRYSAFTIILWLICCPDELGRRTKVLSGKRWRSYLKRQCGFARLNIPR